MFEKTEFNKKPFDDLIIEFEKKESSSSPLK